MISWQWQAKINVFRGLAFSQCGKFEKCFLDLLRFYVKLSLEDFEHEIWRFDTFEDFGN